MSGHPTRSAVAEKEASTSKEGMSLEEKIGMAKKFDREMKDYAKATVKEFLGIYGYEEDADMNMDESESQKSGETSTSQAVDKQTETEPTTSTDCDEDKTSPEKAGPMQARAVETIDLETYDVNGVSEISIPSIEGTSRLESGRSDSEVPEVSCLSDEVLNQPCSTETLMSEVETSELDVQSQREIGSQEESQGELGLRGDVLGSQRELQSQSDICELQGEVGILCDPLGSQEKEQSHSGVSKSQDELGTSEQSEKLGSKGLQNIEILGLHKKHQSESEVLTTSHNTDKIQDEPLEVHTELLRNSETPETMSLTENIKSGIQISELQSELQNQKLGSQIEPQLQNESTESQDQAGTSNETLRIWSEVQTQTEYSHSRDDLETLHETSGPQGELQSDGKGCESQNNRIPSQTLGSNIPVLILAVEETTLQSVQARSVSTEKLLEELRQTGETLVLVDGTLEMHEGHAKSTPTPSEIPDAISHIIPRAESTGEPTVLQEHSYATIGSTSSVVAPGQISQDVSSSLSDSTYGSVEKERSNAMPADESNIECINVEPLTSDGGKESDYLISTVQSSPVGVSVSLENADLSSNLLPADFSMNTPGQNSNIELTQIQPLSTTNASIETKKSEKVTSPPVPESDGISSGDSTVTCSDGSLQSAPGASTNQPGLNSKVEIPQIQPPTYLSVSHSSPEAVQSQKVECSQFREADGVTPSITPSGSGKESCLGSSTQSSSMKVSGSLKDAVLSDESNLVQGSDDITSSVAPSRSSEIASADISTSSPGLNSRIVMQPLSGGNSSLESEQGSDNIPSSVTPSIRSKEITHQSGSNYNIELTTMQSLRHSSISNSSLKTVSSQNVESYSVQGTDDILSNDPSRTSSDESNQSTPDTSTNTPSINPTTQLPTMQPPTFLSIGNSSLEAVQSKPFSASPTTDLTNVTSKGKGRLWTKKHRANETPEKREGRLRAQRERARMRRSNETDVEREARREKDRKRQQLKRSRDKGMEDGDIVDASSQTPQPTKDNISIEDRGLLNPFSTTSQSSMSEVLEGAIDETEVQCSSVVKPGVIPEGTVTIPAKRPKIMQGTEFTVTPVSSEGRKVIDGQQISSGESDNEQSDLCQRAEKGDVQKITPSPVILPEVTDDIPLETSESESSVLREDRDVTASTTTTTEISQDNSDDCALPGNREELDMHRKIDLLNNQILSGLTEPTTSQTIAPGPSASPDDKNIPDHKSCSILETTSATPKDSQPEEQSDPTRDTSDSSRQSNSLLETSSRKLNSLPLPEEHDDSLRDTTKSSRPDISLIETSSGKSKDSESEENPDPPGVTTSLSSPEEHNDSLRGTTKSSRPSISLIETSSGKSKDSESEENTDPPVATTSLSLPEEHNDSLRDTTSLSSPEEHNDSLRDTTKSSRPDISLIETSSGKSKDSESEENPDSPGVTTSLSSPEEHNDSLRDTTKSSRPDISLIETSSEKSKDSESEENPDPPGVTTSSPLPEEHNDSLRDTTKSSRPSISLIETSSEKSNDSEPEENPDSPGVTTSLSSPEEHNDSLRDTTKSYQKEKNRQNVRKRRALETPEQRDARLKEQRERVRKRRANETDAERETRRVQDRVRQQMKRTSESEGSRSKRLTQQRDAARRRRALESPDEKVTRRIKDRDRARKCRESQRAGVVMEWW